MKKLIAAMTALFLLLLCVSPALAFSPGAATTVADWLNFRSAPGMSGRVIDLIPYGSEVQIISEADDWCLIEWNGIRGYVSSQYLAQEIADQAVPGTRAADSSEQPTEPADSGDTYGLIIGDEVRFRVADSLSSNVFGYFYRGTIVKVLDKSAQWTKIEYDNEIGYVATQYVRFGTPTAEEFKAAESVNYLSVFKSATPAPAQPAPSAQTAEPEKTTKTNTQPSTQPATPSPAPTAQPAAQQQPAAQTETAKISTDDIVAVAKSCLGVTYYPSGASMRGFDCSGFTMYVFAQFGISLVHSASGQYLQGTPVEKSDLRPGDLVFFTNDDSRPNIGHVGIYIGNGELLHASSSQYKIAPAKLDSYWFAENYKGACRITK